MSEDWLGGSSADFAISHLCAVSSGEGLIWLHLMSSSYYLASSRCAFGYLFRYVLPSSYRLHSLSEIMVSEQHSMSAQKTAARPALRGLHFGDDTSLKLHVIRQQWVTKPAIIHRAVKRLHFVQQGNCNIYGHIKCTTIHSLVIIFVIFPRK